MRRIALALGLVCLAAAAPAGAVEVQYAGALAITAQAGTCPEGDQVGKRYFARYRPADLGDNPPHSDLNIYENGFAAGHRLLNGSFSNLFKSVQATVVAGGSGLISTQVLIRFLSSTRTEDFVTIRGQIRGFYAQPQCTVTFLLGGPRNREFE